MKKEGLFFIIGLIGFFSIYLDEQILLFISSLRIEFFNSLFIGFHYIFNVIILFFVITSLFLWQENKKKWIIPLWLSLIVSFIIGFLLKIIFMRQRPFLVVSIVPLVSKVYEWWNFAFPSLHAMVVFASVPLLVKRFKKIAWLWYLLACLVAFSRVYIGVHYFSDVLFGGLIGYLIGICVLGIYKKNFI